MNRALRLIGVVAVLCGFAACGSSSQPVAGCVANQACQGLDPCRIGATRCASADAVPACTDVGDVADGSPCGVSKVCRMGACVEACVSGVPCAPANACATGTTWCPTPAAVATCMATGIVLDNTGCDTQRVCIGGACLPIACQPGPCDPQNPCKTGSITCPSGTSGPGTCSETGTRSDDSSCGIGLVCSSGTCTGICEPNQPCQPDNPCSRGTSVCAHHWSPPTCVATGSKPDGAICAVGQICSAGSCVAAIKPVIASFAADPATVGPGGRSTLTWNVSGADALTLDQGIGAVTGISHAVGPIVTTTFRLTATNVTGFTTATATVTVIPIPSIVSFSASPGTITPGSASLLSWDVKNATAVSIDQGIGTVTGTSRSVMPVSTTTFTLTASNSVGSASARATVVLGSDCAASGTCLSFILINQGNGGSTTIPAPLTFHVDYTPTNATDKSLTWKVCTTQPTTCGSLPCLTCTEANSSYGTIDSQGVYTPPASVLPSPRRVYVLACNQRNVCDWSFVDVY